MVCPAVAPYTGSLAAAAIVTNGAYHLDAVFMNKETFKQGLSDFLFNSVSYGEGKAMEQAVPLVVKDGDKLGSSLSALNDVVNDNNKENILNTKDELSNSAAPQQLLTPLITPSVPSMPSDASSVDPQ
jgi:hypothetical protein